MNTNMRAHQLLDSFFLHQDSSGFLPQSLPQGYWLLPLTFWRANRTSIDLSSDLRTCRRRGIQKYDSESHQSSQQAHQPWKAEQSSWS